MAIRRMNTDLSHRLRTLILLGWFLIPLAYWLAARPPIYDGLRHFLFVLPPVFAIGAACLQALFRLLSRGGNGLPCRARLIPGLTGIAVLHPYEYTYFNSLVGGTRGAFREYETDYWLTCYKDAVEQFNIASADPVRLFVHREASVAAPYAAPHVSVLDERGSRTDIHAGDFILVNTRTNEDLRTFRDAPELLRIGRAGATFCVIKAIP